MNENYNRPRDGDGAIDADDDMRIIRYLPPFLQEYKEIQAFTSTEDVEIRGVFAETRGVLDNLFITI